MAEEEDVYGGELPEDVEGELEDPGMEGVTGDEKAEDPEELDAMKEKLQEMEAEAAKLREMQAKVEKEMSVAEKAPAADQATREEADSRSIYIGSVDYACTPEELQVHFQSCGTVNRVTILTDKFGQPKGFAYVEFLEADAVPSAILLNDTELRGRQIKVAAKRTNVPGLKQFPPGGRGRGRGRGGGRGYGGYGGRGFGGGRGRGRGRFGGRGYSPY